MERESREPWVSNEEDPLEVLRAAHAPSSRPEETSAVSPGLSHEHKVGDPQAGGGRRRRFLGSRGFWGGFLLLALIVAVLRYWDRDELREPKREPTREAPAHAQHERKILYWQDPMHPQYTSDKPGKAPDCGMDLVPVYAEESPTTKDLPPGTVQISPRKQQLIGVQYGEVLYQPLSKTIRAVGRIAYDETKIARIHTKVEGWIEKVYVDFTGKLVKKGNPLVSLYSPELVSTQQEFLIAKRAKDYLENNPFREIASSAMSLYESSRERLRLWDITEKQIDEIETRGKPTKTMMLYSPINGFVLTRNAFERQRIMPETELYAIVDLSNIWVLADIYEYEAPLVKLGQAAKMTLPYFPGKTLRGKVTYIYPELDNTTRTLKVRLEFPNSDFQLKPDMYANVELRIDYGRQLVVPEDAVLDSGIEQTVFVARDGGYFEPRQVKLGQKFGNLFTILSGVKAGERVVTSANFLVDSESRLKSAIGGMAGMGHGGHGGEEPSGGKQKSPNPPPSQAPPGSQPDHSQHQSRSSQPPAHPSQHPMNQKRTTSPKSSGQRPKQEMDHSQHQLPGLDRSQHEQSRPKETAEKEPTDHSGHEPKS